MALGRPHAALGSPGRALAGHPGRVLAGAPRRGQLIGRAVGRGRLLGVPLIKHPDPAFHVERDDDGGRVRDPAHHGGDLVRGPVVQHPADERREAAPGQDHRNLGAGLVRFPTDQILCGVQQTPVGGVDHFQRHVLGVADPLLAEPLGP
ncbi:MAG TPA: hypothetical protein VGN41_02990, partial [Streptosporangiaceae bacterium]